MGSKWLDVPGSETAFDLTSSQTMSNPDPEGSAFNLQKWGSTLIIFNHVIWVWWLVCQCKSVNPHGVPPWKVGQTVKLTSSAEIFMDLGLNSTHFDTSNSKCHGNGIVHLDSMIEYLKMAWVLWPVQTHDLCHPGPRCHRCSKGRICWDTTFSGLNLSTIRWRAACIWLCGSGAVLDGAQENFRNIGNCKQRLPKTAKKTLIFFWALAPFCQVGLPANPEIPIPQSYPPFHHLLRIIVSLPSGTHREIIENPRDSTQNHHPSTLICL